ncbi:hypothetical protein AX774_g1287 [Zancudomyces culisetae]|uniref:Uncharacterized protein n=1 Tax=Zancudomyces culisetae TaxID=1213189 RepID=A0A1R1PW34_ZANCU|nr:hypothetical protein AX774_g1287 [Zancudomyces culisetae]|eukprot:OMH85186.1 hypothetical protein AX774_g1287 [Zancudomyces culisetae]
MMLGSFRQLNKASLAKNITERFRIITNNTCMVRKYVSSGLLDLKEPKGPKMVTDYPGPLSIKAPEELKKYQLVGTNSLAIGASSVYIILLFFTITLLFLPYPTILT